MSREDTKNFGDIFREFYDVIIGKINESKQDITSKTLAIYDDNDIVNPLSKTDPQLAYALEPIEGKIYLDYLKPGNYRSTEAATARANVHAASVPSEILSSSGINRGFRLTVMHGGNINSWLQIMFCNDSNSTNDPMIFIRDAYDTKHTTPSQYSDWQLLTIGGDLKTALLMDGKKIGAIAKNEVLETYIAPGNYSCLTREIVKTISDRPHETTDPFRLLVMQTTASTHPRLMQIVIVNTAEGEDKFYFRTSFTDEIAWSKWDTIVSGTKLEEVKQKIIKDVEPMLEKVSKEIEENIEPKIERVTKDIEENLDPKIDTKFDAVTYNETGEDYMLTFFSGEEELAAIKIEGGGGGGGGGSSVLTFTNKSGWLVKSFPASVDNIPFMFNWTSYVGDIQTGPGLLEIRSGGTLKGTINLASQGDVTINLKPFVVEGDQRLSLKLIDDQGSIRTLSITVKLITATMEVTYDESTINAGAFQIMYTTYGQTNDGNKTVYFQIDNGTPTTEIVDGRETGIQKTHNVAALSNGAHIIKTWFTMPLAGEPEPLTSNIVYINCFADNGTARNAMIGSTYGLGMSTTINIDQYNTVTIPYYVYYPLSSSTAVKLQYRRGTSTQWKDIQTLTVNRSKQNWLYTFKDLVNDKDTKYYLRIVWAEDATVYKQFNFLVKKSSLPIKLKDTDRAVYLTAEGRSNAEAAEERVQWYDKSKSESERVSCTLSNFEFNANSGWLSRTATDLTIPEGETVLRIRNGAKCTVNYQPFYLKNFSKKNGVCIELKLAARDIKDFNQEIIKIWQPDDNRGLKITPQNIYFKGSSNALSTQKYKHSEYVTITIMIHKEMSAIGSDNPENIVYIYINGILSNARKYNTNEDFYHTATIDPLKIPNIVIGGTDQATVDISRIRIYSIDLTRDEILDNWICDVSDSQLMLDKYNYNNIMINGVPDYDLLKTRIPCMAITCASDLDENKTKFDYEMVFTNPFDSSRDFTLDYGGSSSAQLKKHNIATQGTSSAVYPLKNFKFKSDHFKNNNGEIKTTYSLAEGIPDTNVFTVKVNYASSEQCNNTIIAMLYNSAQIYNFPKQEYDPTQRFSIYGFPVVVFWRKQGGTTPYQFYSIGQFNLDKGSSAFGFSDKVGTSTSATPYSDTIWYDDGGWCIEPQNNDGTYCLWKGDLTNATLEEIQSDFELRYPDKDIEAVTDIPDLFKQACKAIAATDVTGLSPSSTAYKNKKAAFLAAIDQYFEKDALLFYYVFNALTLGVDQIAKNTMWAHEGAFKARHKFEDGTYDEWKTYPATKIFPMIYDADKQLSALNLF